MVVERKGSIASDFVAAENAHKRPKKAERFFYWSVLLF